MIAALRIKQGVSKVSCNKSLMTIRVTSQDRFTAQRMFRERTLTRRGMAVDLALPVPDWLIRTISTKYFVQYFVSPSQLTLGTLPYLSTVTLVK